MKALIRPLYSVAVLGSLLSCGSRAAAANSATTTEHEALRYHEIRDPQTGMVRMRWPIPESWQVHGVDAPLFVTSPHGLKVHQTEQSQYGWSPDFSMQQTFAMSGMPVAPPAPLEQIVDEQVGPRARADGYRFVGAFHPVCIDGLWQRLLAAMPDTGTVRTVATVATEWEAEDGHRAMIDVVRAVFQSPQSLLWQLYLTRLEAPADYYEAAKQATLYAAANVEINPHWIAASNQAMMSSIRETTRYWDNAIEISRQAHQQRMQSIAARGAAARAVGSTYSDILDISHQGYLDRASLSDEGHDATVDAIAGISVIGNRDTGERYEVQADTSYYWVNADGYYIATDNALFDPRTDEATRDADWTRFHKER